MASLTEKYRPREWSAVIGQEKVVGKLQALMSRGSLAGRAYWLSGQSGTGKTTIAKLIASEVADDFNTDEVDAATLTVSDLVKLENELQTYGFGSKTGRAILINEAHALRKPVIRQLLVFLERIPSHVAVCFTTTVEGQAGMFEDCDDASPLLSRCVRLDLARRDLNKKFAARLREVCIMEGLGEPTLEECSRVVKDSNNNFRAALQFADAGELIS